MGSRVGFSVGPSVGSSVVQLSPSAPYFLAQHGHLATVGISVGEPVGTFEGTSEGDFVGTGVAAVGTGVTAVDTGDGAGDGMHSNLEQNG